MSDFVVGIPSYRRATEQGTVQYLKQLGFGKDRVYVFVQTQEDKEAYDKEISSDATVIYAPASGVAKARNNILNYFDGSENVLMLDDDIKHIGILQEQLRPIETGKEFEQIIGKCFDDCRRRKVMLFGVYPIYNDFYMERSITVKTTVNTLLGIPKGFSLRFDETFTAKEDIELCGRILHAKKNIIRYNFLAVEAKHRTNAGGCKEIWASDEHVATVKRLCAKYPELFEPKKNNPKEVRLKLRGEKYSVA